jgi:hypothetical protein
MSENSPAARNAIPESLRKQLEDFRRQLWRRKVMEAVAAGFIGLLVSFLLIYGLDRIWQTPNWARLLILSGGVSLFGGFAPYWLHRWVWGHRREEQLARLIAKRHPGLGDRLLGVIELQGQSEAGDSLSPRLRAAAMEVVAAEAGKRKLEDALPVPRHRKWALAALALLAVASGAFLATPKAGLNALERWLNPFSDVERYTFTQLEKPPSFLAVPYGEAFDVVLKLAKTAEQRPSEALGQYGLQPGIGAKLAGDRYLFRFPGQQDKGTVIFRIGDLRHALVVEPLQRPGVLSTRAFVKSPDYMRLPDRTVELTTGELSLVEGSRLVFEMDLSREVRSGVFGPGKASGEIPAGTAFGPVEGALEISGQKAKTPQFAVGNVPFELPFSWVDEFGLTGGSDFRLRVDAVKDTPPVAYTQGVDRQKAILPEESLDFEILCEDDFGLKEAGIEWESLVSMPGEIPEVKGELVLAKGAPEERRIAKPVAFSPAAFGIGPQRLALRAFCDDLYPGRGRVYSEPVILYILTREEHQQMLKSQFDRTISELEDLARKELNNLDENQRLDDLDAAEMKKEENRKRLDAQEQAESESARRMEELKQKMEEVMKGATRNGEIDKETMKKMAEALKSMQELADKDVPEVRDQLQEAQEPSNADEKTEQDIKEAVEKQKKVVEKMKEAVEKANEANKRFEASTFVSRLKKAAAEQNGIAGTLIETFSRNLIGEFYEKLNPSDQMKITETARQQMLTASDVRWIQEDLGHYHARTGDAMFKTVMEQMRDSKIDIGLEDVRSKLQIHRSYLATEGADFWAKKLNEWAAILGDELNKGGGGGGGGGGGASPEDEDFEFMLRVMKMIQQQQDLRARTRVLEQLKRDAGTLAPTNE